MNEAIEGYLFYEIAALLVLAALAGLVGLLLRQPLIVSFIAVGVLAGPAGFDIVHSEAQIELLAELGIAVLLFLVGLKLDLGLVRTLGPVALMTGLGQVVFTTIFGFLIALGRYGSAIARALEERGLRILGVDFDPMAVRHARETGLPVRFGDASDPEFLAQLPLRNVPWIVSALQEYPTGITHIDPRRSIIRGLRDLGFEGRIAVAAHSDTWAERLQEAGADLVLLPFRDAAAQAAYLINGSTEPAAEAPDDPLGQRQLPE